MDLAELSTYFQQKRLEFPILERTVHAKPFVYLDTAATSLKPRSVISSLQHFYEQEYATIHRSVYLTAVEAEHKYHIVRQRLADYLSASRPEEIIFCRGTTEAINLVANSFGKRFVDKGDSILVSAMEHHSNLVPWQILCEERGAHLKFAPIDDQGNLNFEALEALLAQGPKIFSICHISNVLGTINPLKKIIKIAKKYGTKVFVDGAQAPAHLRIDLEDLGADFYAFSAHKLYGPTGLGFLYGKHELLEEMPPYQGGGDMIQSVEYEKSSFAAPPLKFEAGTPMIAQVIAFGAVLDLIESLDYQALGFYENSLLQSLEEGLSEIPSLSILGQSKAKAPIVTFKVEGVHSLDIASMLDLKGIAIRSGHHCAQPLLKLFNCSTAARVSIGMYNTEEEIAFFLKSLKEVLSVLSK